MVALEKRPVTELGSILLVAACIESNSATAGSAVSPRSFQNRRGVANRSTLSSSPAREPGNEARVPPVHSKGPRTGEDKLQEKKQTIFSVLFMIYYQFQFSACTTMIMLLNCIWLHKLNIKFEACLQCWSAIGMTGLCILRSAIL